MNVQIFIHVMSKSIVHIRLLLPICLNFESFKAILEYFAFYEGVSIFKNVQNFEIPIQMQILSIPIRKMARNFVGIYFFNSNFKSTNSGRQSNYILAIFGSNVIFTLDEIFIFLIRVDTSNGVRQMAFIRCC